MKKPPGVRALMFASTRVALENEERYRADLKELFSIRKR